MGGTMSRPELEQAQGPTRIASPHKLSPGQIVSRPRHLRTQGQIVPARSLRVVALLASIDPGESWSSPHSDSDQLYLIDSPPQPLDNPIIKFASRKTAFSWCAF